MALTFNALPSQPANFAVPFDRQAAFCENQTRTTSGDFNNVNAQVDLGGIANLAGGAAGGSGVGRTTGIWVVNVTAMDLVTNDGESYRIFLLGSNDVSFAAGNVECLGLVDFAATAAARIISGTLGVSLPAPTRVYRPFTNMSQVSPSNSLIFRYLRCTAVIGGATPSITLTSWLSIAREMI